MGTFGEKLQRERELRGITLEEIAGATKIGARSLRALEEEEFEKLPGGIFNKGFVRAYARYLGINEEQAVADYLAACGEPGALPVSPALEAAQRTEKVRERLPSSDDSRRSGIWISALVLLLVIAGLGAGSWKLYARYKLHVAEKLRAAAAAVAHGRQPASPSALPGGIAPVSPPPLAPTATAIPQLSAPPLAPDSAVPATVSPASPPATSPSSSAFQRATTAAAPAPELLLLIRARDKSWISVKADGKMVIQDTLPAGGGTSVHARRQLILTTGNAGGIQVVLNGKELPSLGANKQVRTVLLTATGIAELPGEEIPPNPAP